MENCILEISGEKLNCISNRPGENNFEFVVDSNFALCYFVSSEIKTLKLIVTGEDGKNCFKLNSFVSQNWVDGKYTPKNIDVKLRFSDVCYRINWLNSVEIKKTSNNWDEYEISIETDSIEEIGQEELITQALARGYCHPENSNKVLDPELIMAMTKEVKKLLKEGADCSKVSK